MSIKPNREELALISYAIGTEADAVSTYNYLLKHVRPEFRAVIKHIRKEEEEHIEELKGLLNGDVEENV